MTVFGTPDDLMLHVRGRDSDATFKLYKNLAGSECIGNTSDFDVAEGHRTIYPPAGVTSGDKQAFAPFMATGTEDLEFRVHGVWQIVP